MGAFLADMASRPFVWGETDCGQMMGAWVAACRGANPAEPLRGRYNTAAGGTRAILRLGGFPAAGRHLMSAVGLEETDEPREGDAGLVQHPVVGPAFAVHAGLGWAVKSDHGIMLGPWPVIVAWRV